MNSSLETRLEVLTNDLSDDIINFMNSISISQLKINPSLAIKNALDFPLAVESRNEVKAYILGKDLYELIVTYMENATDRQAVEETDFSTDVYKRQRLNLPSCLVR